MDKLTQILKKLGPLGAFTIDRVGDAWQITIIPQVGCEAAVIYQRIREENKRLFNCDLSSAEEVKTYEGTSPNQVIDACFEDLCGQKGRVFTDEEGRRYRVVEEKA